MNQRLTIFIVPIFMLFVFNAKAQESFTLQQAMDYAVENSITQKNAKLDYRITDRRSFEVIAEGFPQINAEVNYQNNFRLPVSLVPMEFLGGPEGEYMELKFGLPHNMNASVTATQLIFDFRYFVGVQANRALKKSAKSQLKQSEIEVRKNVEEAYYTALAAQETVDIMSGNLETITKTLEETQQLFESGFAEQLDVDRLKLSRSNLETQVQNMEKQAQLAKVVLKFQMGFPIDNEIILEEKLEDLFNHINQVETAYDYQNRIEYQLLQTQFQLRDYDISQTRAGYFPSIYAFGSYSFDAQRDEFNFFDSDEPWFRSGFAGIQVRVPIFDGFLRRSQVQQRQLDLMKINNQIQNFEEMVGMEVKNTRTELENAIRNFNLQQENLQLAERIYQTTVTKYQQGLGSSLEVSNAESDLTQTQANYIQSIFDAVIARSRLNHAMGLYENRNN